MAATAEERTTQAMVALAIAADSEQEVAAGDAAMAAAADKPEGKKKLVRFDKDYTEHILWAGSLAPFPRMRDDLIDRLEQPDFPGRVRAEQDALCALVEKKIARYNKIREQFLHKRHAEVEFSDEEEAAAEVASMERHARRYSNLNEEDMAFYAAVGSTVDARRRWNAATAGMPKVVGEDGKRRTVVRLEKEYIEWKVTNVPPPRPYPFMSSKDPACRAMDEEIAADAQKDIYRDAKMRRQYAIQGYADVEFTDDERDEEELEDWRPWAYRKAAGLVD